MEIHLAKSAGFCFGVKRAIEIALRTAKKNNKVYMLGDIVHNEEVVRRIECAGIKKIKKLSPAGGEILLIRAHGAPLKVFEQAARLGYKIVDATCPMVKEIHKIAKGMEKKGYKIIVIGDKKHDEVRGIMGQLKGRAIVIDSVKNIPKVKIKSAGVMVQSTQNIDEVKKIVGRLKKICAKIEFHNTICRPTRLKQEELKKMPLENDVMIVIGSKTSANTRRLYEIAKSLNKHSYWIVSKKEINTGWFKGVKSAGVTAGASTPDDTTYEVVKYIAALNA